MNRSSAAPAHFEGTKKTAYAVFFLYPENHSLGEWFKKGCCR